LTSLYASPFPFSLSSLYSFFFSPLHFHRHLNHEAQRQGTASYAIAIVSVFFLPLTFVAGVYGMNFGILYYFLVYKILKTAKFSKLIQISLFLNVFLTLQSEDA
jgi:Mg2+ and Co2+ transporter CorA